MGSAQCEESGCVYGLGNFGKFGHGFSFLSLDGYGAGTGFVANVLLGAGIGNWSWFHGSASFISFRFEPILSSGVGVGRLIAAHFHTAAAVSDLLSVCRTRISSFILLRCLADTNPDLTVLDEATMPYDF